MFQIFFLVFLLGICFNLLPVSAKKGDDAWPNCYSCAEFVLKRRVIREGWSNFSRKNHYFWCKKPSVYFPQI